MRLETTRSPTSPALGAGAAGDSVRHHISPAGSISRGASTSPRHGIERKDFNSYGSRRGNHEVMIRGTFANIRLRNLLLTASRAASPATSFAGGAAEPRSSSVGASSPPVGRWWCSAGKEYARVLA